MSLLYHRQLDETWEREADALRRRLGIDIIGRARKQKRCSRRISVAERVADGKEYSYKQLEGSFTQPNAESRRRCWRGRGRRRSERFGRRRRERARLESGFLEFLISRQRALYDCPRAVISKVSRDGDIESIARRGGAR